MVENTQNNATKQHPKSPAAANCTKASTTNCNAVNKRTKKRLEPRLRFGDYIDYRYYTISEPPKNHASEMFAECSGEPSTDCRRRWLIRRLIKFNKSYLDMLKYPERYLENPHLYNSTRRPLPPSSTPDTYIHDPDYGCDPYHNSDLYDQATLTFKETINVPFYEIVKKTNMNRDITKRRTDDNGDHPPVPHADEQDMELQVIVSPPAYPRKPTLKPQNTCLQHDRKQVTYKSSCTHQRNQGLDDNITIIPSKSRTSSKKTLKSNGNHNHRSTRRIQSRGPAVNPITQTSVASTQKTRRIRRALTCEFDNNSQPNAEEIHEPENHKQNEGNMLLQLDPNLLTSIPTSDSPAGEQCLPLFSATPSNRRDTCSSRRWLSNISP